MVAATALTVPGLVARPTAASASVLADPMPTGTGRLTSAAGTTTSTGDVPWVVPGPSAAELRVPMQGAAIPAETVAHLGAEQAGLAAAQAAEAAKAASARAEAAKALADRAAAQAKARATREAAQRADRWVRPNAGPLTSYYGTRWGRLHAGLDFGGSYGSPIYAAAAGTVSYAGPANGYGRLVTIAHPDGSTTAYGHMSAILVRTGQSVSAGETIARVGNEGHSTGPHLHFEVRIGAGTVNPLPWLRTHGVSL